MTLIQEIAGEEVRTTLAPGEYAINSPGVWHTADVPDHATGFFVTSGWAPRVARAELAPFDRLRTSGPARPSPLPCCIPKPLVPSLLQDE